MNYPLAQECGDPRRVDVRSCRTAIGWIANFVIEHAAQRELGDLAHALRSLAVGSYDSLVADCLNVVLGHDDHLAFEAAHLASLGGVMDKLREEIEHHMGKVGFEMTRVARLILRGDL